MTNGVHEFQFQKPNCMTNERFENETFPQEAIFNCGNGVLPHDRD